SPVEAAVSTWATTLLTNQGYKERKAAWVLSGFWLGFLASRVLTVWLEYKLRDTWAVRFEPWLIVILGLMTAVSLGDLAGTPSKSGAAWGLFAVGFFLGPIFPTLVAIVFQHAKSELGTAFGVLYSCGALGSFLVAPVIGLYARQTTVQRALWIPMVVALAATAAALVLGLTM